MDRDSKPKNSARPQRTSNIGIMWDCIIRTFCGEEKVQSAASRMAAKILGVLRLSKGTSRRWKPGHNQGWWAWTWKRFTDVYAQTTLKHIPQREISAAQKWSPGKKGTGPLHGLEKTQISLTSRFLFYHEEALLWKDKHTLAQCSHVSPGPSLRCHLPGPQGAEDTSLAIRAVGRKGHTFLFSREGRGGARSATDQSALHYVPETFKNFTGITLRK